MSAPAPGRRRRALLALLLSAGVLSLLAVFTFVLRPLWCFERLGRLTLRISGLTRREIPGERGPLVYWSGGAGSTVVLLHGANDQAGVWARVAPPLLASHRLLALDLPGHGDSAPANGTLAAGDLLRGVERLVDADGGGARVTLVGNSLGGWLALGYALKHPGRVSHVVLVNGAAIRFTAAAEIQLLPTTREQARAAFAGLTAAAAPQPPDFVLDDLVRRAPGSPLARLLRAPEDASMQLDGRLGGLDAPVTLLWGDADRLLPVSYAEKVKAALPEARLETIAGCGHVPMRECPQLLVPLLLRALAEPGRP